MMMNAMLIVNVSNKEAISIKMATDIVIIMRKSVSYILIIYDLTSIPSRSFIIVFILYYIIFSYYKQ